MKKKILAIQTAFSAVLLFFISESSPFFYINNWVDAQAYFTVGKSVWHGLWPYKDLFEQKGPLLYWLHTLASGISYQNFFGVYLLEILAMTATLYLAQRILALYSSEKWALIFSWLLPLALVQMPYFREGDSAEEFTFPLVMGLLWLIFKWEKTKELPTNKQLFIQGILLSCAFWIKYTLLGPWIGFFLVFGIYLIFKKAWQDLFRAIGITLLSIVVTSLIIVSPLMLSHSFTAMINVYFKFNLTSYSTIPGLNHYLFPWIALGNVFSNQLIFTFFGILGFIFFFGIIKKFPYWPAKMALLMAFLMTVFLTYYGGHAYDYYHLALRPFAIIGLVVMSTLVSSVKVKTLFVWVSLIIASCLIGFVNQNWRYNRFNENNPEASIGPNIDRRPAQIIFGEYLKRRPKATLLNYATLDLGVYLTSDKIPMTRYFENQNVSHEVYPANMDTQERIIRNESVDYIVTRSTNGLSTNYPFLYPLLAQHYRVVMYHFQQNQDINYVYWLLKKK